MWCESSQKTGVAIDNFDGRQVPNGHGLSLDVGERVRIFEKCSGWLRGCTLRNKHVKGIFPASYITCTPEIRSYCRSSSISSSTACNDPLLDEVTCTIKDWSEMWRSELFVKGSSLCSPIKKVLCDLVQLRKELLTQALASKQLRELREKIGAKIDWGNRQLKMDLVPRQEGGSHADPDFVGPVQLYRLHVQAAANSAAGGSNRETTMRTHKSSPASSHHQLLLRLLRFECQLTNDDVVEVHFTMYNAKESKNMCERISFKVKDGKYMDSEETRLMFQALIADLTNADFHMDVYLVAHIYRLGNLLNKDNLKKGRHIPYKRPIGCAVLGINDVLQSCSVDPKEEQLCLMKIVLFHNESDFATMADSLIKKQAVKEAKLTGPNASNEMQVSLRMVHGDLVAARKSNPLLFTKALVIARKMGFGDASAIDDSRNDFYIVLSRGEFDKGTKSAGLNVEVRVTVMHKNDGQLHDCIAPAAGENLASEYKSIVFYHSNQPRWNETIRVSIPVEKFVESHVRFEFRHCSRGAAEKKLFAFGYLNLADTNGMTVVDGLHELCLYKINDVYLKRASVSDFSKLSEPQFYCGLPCTVLETETRVSSSGNAYCIRSAKESCFVETLLCSTKLTQNGQLLNLFKWREKVSILESVLADFKQVKSTEVIKFHADILSVLFEIFAEGSSTNDSTFDTLVHVLKVLKEHKDGQGRSLFETYLKQAFSSPLAYRYLLQGMCWATGQSHVLAQALKVLDMLFKLIVQSAILNSRTATGDSYEEFQEEMNNFWRCVRIMVSSNPEIRENNGSADVSILDSLTTVLDELLRITPPAVLTSKFVEMLEDVAVEPLLSLPSVVLVSSSPERGSPVLAADGAQKSLVPLVSGSKAGEPSLQRLQCMQRLIKSALFKDEDSRPRLLSLCSEQLKACFITKRHIGQAIDTLGDVLASLHDCGQTAAVNEHTQIIVTDLLDIVISCLLERLSTEVGSEQRDSPRSSASTCKPTGLLVACVVAMLHTIDDDHFRCIIKELPSKDVQKQLIVHILQVLTALLSQGVIPSDWMVMLMATNSVIMKTMELLCRSLLEAFFEGSEFDALLWMEFFNLGICFITQPCLQHEKYRSTKMERLLEHYQDMRLLAWNILLPVWQSLGSRRKHFIPKFVGPFLEVSLIPKAELRQLVLPVFFDMMLHQQKTSGNFKMVECELIDKLDIHINENKGDRDYLKAFQTILLQKTENEPLLKEDGTAFIKSVCNLMERLVDYRAIMQCSESKEAHMISTMNLLKFYEDEIHREELYCRYVYKLADLHLEAKNYTEAGCTLLMYARRLEWCSRELPPDGRNSTQQEWAKKKQLYEQIINCFDKGESWDLGIPLCKELAEFLEMQLYDYEKLSIILKTEAKFFDNILRKEPDSRSYFRVGFFGRTFPLFLRNKVFVYRGDPFDKIGTLTKKLNAEFPNARILNPNVLPTEEMKEGDVEYIQLCAVRQLPGKTKSFENAARPVSDKIKNYYAYSQMDHFQYDRAFHKDNKRDEKNEFKSLCLCRYTMRTSSPLPGMLRWVEVIDSSSTELSPLETAIDAVQKKNKELQDVIREFSDKKVENIQPLSMQLKGVIDAAVNGGIARYQEAFFSADYALSHPEDTDHISNLKSLFTDQINILNGGIRLHNYRMPDDMKPFHDNLVETLKKMKRSVRETTMTGDFDFEVMAATPHSNSANNSVLLDTPVGRSSRDSSGSDIDMLANAGLLRMKKRLIASSEAGSSCSDLSRSDETLYDNKTTCTTPVTTTHCNSKDSVWVSVSSAPDLSASPVTRAVLRKSRTPSPAMFLARLNDI